MEKTPISKQTITPTMLAKLGANHGVNLLNYDVGQLEDGIIKELETMQTYTAQALTSDKLDRAFVTAFNNINQDPSYYNNNPPFIQKQDIFNVNENKLSLSKVYLAEKYEFKFNQFKKMDSNEQGELLKQFPKIRLGKGSSRYVVNIGNGKVIKFAMNQAGRLQNREEVKINKKSGKYESLLPKVYDYDPKFQWILSEIVNELKHTTADKIFKNKTGITFKDFQNFIWSGGDHPTGPVNKFLQHVEGLVDNLGVGYGDLGAEHHWGTTADGNLVLLDYGYANDVQDQYSNNRSAILKPDHVFESKNYDSFKESFKLSNVYKNQLLFERKQFDFRTWKSLPPVKQVLFLKQNGESIGKGSSREVYLVDNKTALKLARNEKGIAQNKAEVDVSNDPTTKGLITRIYDYSPDYRWLASELVKPFDNEEEFERLTGMSFEDMTEDFESSLQGYGRSKFKSGEYIDTDQVENPLVGKLIDLVQYKDFMHGDLSKLSSWGKTADGRLALLDYGFNQEVADKHYKPLHRKAAKSDVATAVPSSSEEQTANDDKTSFNQTNKLVGQKNK